MWEPVQDRLNLHEDPEPERQHGLGDEHPERHQHAVEQEAGDRENEPAEPEEGDEQVQLLVRAQRGARQRAVPRQHEQPRGACAGGVKMDQRWLKSSGAG